MSTFPTLRIAGGLFGPDLPEQLLRGELPYQQPEDFGISSRRHLNDEIAAVFHDACTLWGVFQNRLARLDERDSATSLTRDAWMIPLLSMLGYELRYNARAYDIDGMSFAISHRLGEDDDAVPVHIVGVRQELDHLAPGGRPRLAPHTLLQEFLNRTEHLWGIVTNGRIIRLLRDSTYIRRQVYLEFDLATMIEEQHFQDFAVFYRLLHRSRLPRTASAARSCPLEIYYQHALEQGSRVREKLREGVEACLQQLANGFLRHRDSQELRAWVAHHGAAELYRQLLRLVYRLLFLLVSEERGLISADPLYREHYSITRLRTLVERPDAFTDHDDLWCSLRVLWMVLRDDTPHVDGQPLATLLGLPVLNGDLFAEQELDHASITNRDLLRAFWYLTFYDSPPRRINYAALDTEELGSVYESLLELHPHLTGADEQMCFTLAVRGTERRATGSHYTPPELVGRLVHQTLEPVLRERLAACRTNREREAAILTLKILDPACGSGHFLLAAARRLGKELARLRTGTDEPPPEAIQNSVRDAITHCIYGVDKNPLAVELCRVALWLEGHTRDKPLTFLEQHIRCGDSLIGLADLSLLKDGIPDAAYRPVGNANRALLTTTRKRNAKERQSALFQYSFITQLLAEVATAIQQIVAMPETTIAEVRAKRTAFAQLQRSVAFRQLKDACDTYTAAFFGQETTPPLLFTTADLYEVLRRDTLPDPQTLSRVTELSHRHAFFHWALEFADILGPRDSGSTPSGFDVIIGNPPFMGGLRISSTFGAAYRLWLEAAYHPFGGIADLCAAFFRRAFTLLKPGGRLGLIATNTLGQGDTRESGLKVILAQGGWIPFAQRFVTWPGQANVEVNLVVIEAPRLRSDHSRRTAAILDDQPVPFISSRLDDQPEREPVRLPLNEGKAFIGDYVRGIGFVLEPAEARALIECDPRNADCLFPYLNGEDLNSHPAQQPSRWVICFHDWELARAQQYPDLLRMVEERVKPEREKLRSDVAGYDRLKQRWWLYAAFAKGMRQAIAPLRRVLVRSRVSELHAMVFVPQGYIYNEQLIVFAYDDDYHFALLQSAVHEVWVRKQASSLRTDLRYTPTDCFATFPFPPAEYEQLAAGAWQLSDMPPVFWQAAQIGATYYEHRRQIMQARQLGLTKTYNLFHNPTCTDADIVELRRLHVALDRIIMACYGWDDLDPQHDFYPNERGQIRYTVAPSVQRELVWRLMELNR
ncbi:type IIL restriction-modification enzyme MmeI [Chloroflexus sp. Y-396-1]|uniref:Eco57I restriction-modification methylase domain-containing protein n=1 Tax=Chloroflexus sp. Y-396-1 TaxID=867845 RepID=UPI0004B349C8|nr:type IIL restriction-modification enzyme MmeI [Chloroflexus sp. Y-396-1]